MDFDRFIAAQDLVYPQVRAELAAGSKRTHWMWFVFPQLAGLATSERSVRYAIPSLAAARDYLMHPLLGSRLLQCTGLVLEHRDKSARDILGYPDDLKFHSSMTLFSRAAEGSEPLTSPLRGESLPSGLDPRVDPLVAEGGKRAGEGALVENAAHACFRVALDTFYAGSEDEHTLARLSLSPSGRG